MKDVKIITFEKYEDYYAETGRFGSHYLINNDVTLPDKTSLVVTNGTHITTARLEEIDIVSEYRTSTELTAPTISEYCDFIVNNKFRYCPHLITKIKLDDDIYHILFAYDMYNNIMEDSYVLIDGEFVHCENVPELPYDSSNWQEIEFTEEECDVIANVLYDNIENFFIPLTESLRYSIHQNIKEWYENDTAYEIYDYDTFIVLYTKKYGYDVYFSIEDGKYCILSESGDYEVKFARTFATVLFKKYLKRK